MTTIYGDVANKSTLVSHNVRILDKRTSVKLEPAMWNELKNIALRESCTINDLCSLICIRKNKNTTLTAAIRVFLMLYFKAASTETGHAKAGHGSFEAMKKRAGLPSDWEPKNNHEHSIQERLHVHLSDVRENRIIN